MIGLSSEGLTHERFSNSLPALLAVSWDLTIRRRRPGAEMDAARRPTTLARLLTRPAPIDPRRRDRERRPAIRSRA
jgi:hypothetical protein